MCVSEFNRVCNFQTNGRGRREPKERKKEKDLSTKEKGGSETEKWDR